MLQLTWNTLYHRSLWAIFPQGLCVTLRCLSIPSHFKGTFSSVPEWLRTIIHVSKSTWELKFQLKSQKTDFQLLWHFSMQSLMVLFLICLEYNRRKIGTKELWVIEMLTFFWRLYKNKTGLEFSISLGKINPGVFLDLAYEAQYPFPRLDQCTPVHALAPHQEKMRAGSSLLSILMVGKGKREPWNTPISPPGKADYS